MRLATPVPATRVRNARLATAALAKSMRTRRGLGDCPAFAPYATPGGGCSNLPPEIDADAYFRGGGKLDQDTQTIVGWTGSSEPTLACPYGSELNPFTGRTECKTATEVKYTTGSGYVQRAGSQAAMSEIAAAAQKEANARGIPVRCGSYPIGGDPITHEQRYAPGCVVGNGVIGGPDTYDAAVMLTGGGMETLATQLGISPFFKASAGYQYTPPTSQQQTSVVRSGATQQTTPAPTKLATETQTPVRTEKKSAPLDNEVTDSSKTEKPGFDLNSVIDQAKTYTSSLPLWVLPAAGAGLALMLFMGGRKR